MPSSTLEPIRTDDEHGIIAQHCRNLNHGTLPTVCFRERENRMKDCDFF